MWTYAIKYVSHPTLEIVPNSKFYETGQTKGQRRVYQFVREKNWFRWKGFLNKQIWKEVNLENQPGLIWTLLEK